jgi:hypothetical protein
MKQIITIVLIFAFIAPGVVATTVNYPPEYNILTEKSNVWYNAYNWVDSFYNGNDRANVAQIGSFLELRRHTILMEKQNEFLAEQNELLRKNAGISYDCEVTRYFVGKIDSFSCKLNAPIEPARPIMEIQSTGCYQNETGQDPRYPVMHITCPAGTSWGDVQNGSWVQT